MEKLPLCFLCGRRLWIPAESFFYLVNRLFGIQLFICEHCSPKVKRLFGGNND